MKKMIIFNGSPRKQGTSVRFAETLGKHAAAQGVEVMDIVHIIDLIDKKITIDMCIALIDAVDTIGICMPLYVDYMPYPVLFFLERIQEVAMEKLAGKQLFAVMQSGFPDIRLMASTFEALRIFAVESTMKWMGGLAFGGGAIINGTSMDKLGKKGAKISRAFQMAVEDLVLNQPFQPKVQTVLEQKIPIILFYPLTWYMNGSAKKQAKANGVDLFRRVYQTFH